MHPLLFSKKLYLAGSFRSPRCEKCIKSWTFSTNYWKYMGYLCDPIIAKKQRKTLTYANLNASLKIVNDGAVQEKSLTSFFYHLRIQSIPWRTWIENSPIWQKAYIYGHSTHFCQWKQLSHQSDLRIHIFSKFSFLV